MASARVTIVLDPLVVAAQVLLGPGASAYPSSARRCTPTPASHRAWPAARSCGVARHCGADHAAFGGRGTSHGDTHPTPTHPLSWRASGTHWGGLFFLFFIKISFLRHKPGRAPVTGGGVGVVVRPQQPRAPAGMAAHTTTPCRPAASSGVSPVQSHVWQYAKMCSSVWHGFTLTAPCNCGQSRLRRLWLKPDLHPL